MMELKEPKRKRRVPPILQQSFPIPVGGISAISAGHWQIYYGSYLGDCIVVEDPSDMAALYSKGFFGKGSLSRDMPTFQKGAAKTPIFIRQRQWERRRTWAKKQKLKASNIQQMFAQESKQKISDSVSRMPLKDQCHSSPEEPVKEDLNVSEKAAKENRTVAGDETDKHREGTEHTTTNLLTDKLEMESELVELESEDEVKEAVKSSEKNYDVILLDSEDDEAISVVDEAGSSRGTKTSKNQNCALPSNTSQSKSASGKEVDVASEDSEDSIILNESEEKTEIISVEETNKFSDVKDNDGSRSNYKRGSQMMNDVTVPQDKKRRLSGKDNLEIELVNANKLETVVEKSCASREDEEVILIDMEECSKEAVEEKINQKQKELENKTTADERITGKNDAIEKSENEDDKRELDRSQDTVNETEVSLSDKHAEETDVQACKLKPTCESKPSAMETNTATRDTEAEDACGIKHFAEPDASNSDNVTATEKYEENVSDPVKTKTIHSSADDTVDMELETSGNITKNADEHETEVHKDNENGSTNGDDDLVLVLSDGDSDSEEFVKNLNPRLEKEMFPVRETLQLMLEEAFFLSFGLGCLQVIDMCGNILSLTKMWQLFRKSDASFTSKYIAYHHYRSKGWVVKPGLKFGGDFLLYKQGPAFYHSSYIVIVETLNGTSWILDDRDSKSLTWTRLHGLVRLAESSGKEIMLCQVIKPPDVTQESMDSPSIISKFKVHEQLIRRWVSSEEREDDDDDASE